MVGGRFALAAMALCARVDGLSVAGPWRKGLTFARPLLMAEPPSLDAAALVGEWELEEREDSWEIKTLVWLGPDGSLTLGATSGPPPIAGQSCCSWTSTTQARGAAAEVSMDLVLERRYPAPNADIMMAPEELPASMTYSTARSDAATAPSPARPPSSHPLARCSRRACALAPASVEHGYRPLSC